MKGDRARRTMGLQAWVLDVIWFLGVILCAGLTACSPSEDEPVAEPLQSMWTDRALDVGIDFVHQSGRAGDFYMPEIMGSGVALFDADGDGDLDLYAVQAGRLDAVEGELPMDRLYLNRLVEDGALRFEDATEASGIRGIGYGMGVAAGDVDGDGDQDLYVTQVGPDQLWLNGGDGTFESASGPWQEVAEWSVSALMVDVDGDRLLDLFVVHYLDFHLGNHRICPTSRGEDDYCGPVSFRPLRDRLYRNLGGGRFEDVSTGSGIASKPGSGLGTVATDVDGDGDVDLFVANDKMANFLWLGDGQGGFESAADLWGCDLNRQGQAEAGMGVDAADLDGDGDDELLIVHLAGESHTLYRNDGAYFTDITTGAALTSPSLPVNGFGAALADLDLDGWLDVLVAAGHVHRLPHLVETGDPFPYHQPNQWLRGRADGTFEDVTTALGGDLARSRVSRGLAVGDVDNDGDLDAVITAMDGPLALLINGHDLTGWLGIQAVEPSGGDALGARVRLEGHDSRVLWRRVDSGGSYASARDPRVLLPMPSDAASTSVQIYWADGTVEGFDGLLAGLYHRLERGQGGVP